MLFRIAPHTIDRFGRPVYPLPRAGPDFNVTGRVPSCAEARSADATPVSDPRILFLINPGKQSRHYMLGLARAAERLGLWSARLQLEPIWSHLGRHTGADQQRVLQNVHTQIGLKVRNDRITHVVGYVFNGTHDLGLFRGEDGDPDSIFRAMGVRHLMLWTDHPEWTLDGMALADPIRGTLARPGLVHFVKSRSAAEEVRHVLGWRDVHAIDMAEDYTTLAPAPSVSPVHDVVAIIGGAPSLPAPVTRFLSEDDPDTSAVDESMHAAAESMWRSSLAGGDPGLDALAADWLAAKLASPESSFWRLARSLDPAHAPALDWLGAQPRRWYSGVQALRTMTGWRRAFWLAWLARRVNLGVYGADAAKLGIEQPAPAKQWVEYEKQSSVYALGRAAINTNAAHDEEGLTHKPFQIAASGVACIHHATLGLEDCFEPGSEIAVFRNGPELLDAVGRLASDTGERSQMAAAMRDRARRDHTWECRLAAMLDAARAENEPSETPPQTARA